jgi:dienelactone hydrolase
MSARIFAAFLAVAALGAPPASAIASPSLWAGLHPGSDRVGFRRLGAGAAEVDVWYPAAAAGRPMRFADYLDDTAATARFLRGAGVPALEAAVLLASPLAARADAPARPGARPLVLVGQGNEESASDQAVLCEFLASAGYVVATTPSPMRSKPLESADQVGAFAELQCNDLAAAIGAVAAALPVDTTRVAVVGHSFGARAGLLLAMRNPRVRALVSLDGGIGTATGLASFRAAPSFRTDAPLPPILHFYERLDSFMTPDFTLLHELHARALDLREVRSMHHTHFTTYGFAVARAPGLARVTHATLATSRSARSVAEETRRFLDRALKE